MLQTGTHHEPAMEASRLKLYYYDKAHKGVLS